MAAARCSVTLQSAAAVAPSFACRGEGVFCAARDGGRAAAPGRAGAARGGAGRRGAWGPRIHPSHVAHGARPVFEAASGRSRPALTRSSRRSSMSILARRWRQRLAARPDFFGGGCGSALRLLRLPRRPPLPRAARGGLSEAARVSGVLSGVKLRPVYELVVSL